MDTMSRQEILVAYICVIGTVAVVLLWSQVTGIRNVALGRAPSSTRRGAYEREASLVQSAPALLEKSGLTRGGMLRDGGGQRAGPTPSSARMRANAREAPATPRSPAVPPACARWLFENKCGVSALEERCAEREKDRRPREMTLWV